MKFDVWFSGGVCVETQENLDIDKDWDKIVKLAKDKFIEEALNHLSVTEIEECEDYLPK